MLKSCFFACVFMMVCVAMARADIPSTDYVGALTSALNATVVHIAGDESIAGAKSFVGTVTVPAPGEGSNDTTAATTGWTNTKIAAAKGEIPLGTRDSTTYTKIWVEEASGE